MGGKYEKRPNIILILTDDQGPWAMGCAGNREIRTPNLDRLANTGVRFENFFCTSPVCSPARASLLTGRIPSQHGVHDWIQKGNIGKNSIEYLKRQLAYTDVLAENGYTCGISGKWHLGDSFRPQKGFSHWYVHQRGAGPYYGAPMIRNGKLVNEPGYITDLITDDALSYLDKQAQNERPFYLSVHYTAPHAPWIGNHPEEIVDSYDDCPFDSCPQEPDHPWIRTDITAYVRKDVRGNLQAYFAAVTAMDMNVGRIIDKLKELDLQKSTLVCFLSDNGFSFGHHGFWGKGNGTFPLNMYENSVRVPAIFSHPGSIPQSIVCDELVSGYDFMPTLLEYVGLKNPEADRLPGRSFLPLLLGKRAESREHVVVYDEYGPVRMIRTKEYKYVHRYPYGPHELYDLVNDPGEYDNLINDSSKRRMLTPLRAMLQSWFMTYVDPKFDGVYEPVTGLGQVHLSGPEAGGVRSFAGETESMQHSP